MPNIIYIMGKSSAGKDTIYQKVQERIDINLYLSYKPYYFLRFFVT